MVESFFFLTFAALLILSFSLFFPSFCTYFPPVLLSPSHPLAVDQQRTAATNPLSHHCITISYHLSPLNASHHRRCSPSHRLSITIHLQVNRRCWRTTCLSLPHSLIHYRGFIASLLPGVGRWIINKCVNRLFRY